MSWRSAHTTWLGAAVAVAAFAYLSATADDLVRTQSLPPLRTLAVIVLAIASWIVARDERLRHFGRRFPAWIGLVAFAAGLALARYGSHLFGQGNYVGIMGATYTLLFVGLVLVRNGWWFARRS